MRLLITGSRSWKDYDRLCHCLDKIAEQFAHHHKERYIKEGLILVSGHAYGADAMGEAWFLSRFPLELPEIHKAEWKKYNKRAGVIRNTEMVDSMPDACAGFLMPCDQDKCPMKGKHWSHGADHCTKYADSKDIPTTCFYGGELIA